MILFRLFILFFQTGLFSFGGGMATVPFLYEMSEQTGWFTSSELIDMIAVSESTPGPIGVNMATYVGFTTAGIAGSVIATLGLVTPSIIVMIIVSKIMLKFRESKTVSGVFTGLRPASLGLICAACLQVIRVSLLDLESYGVTGSILSIFNYKSIILAAIVFVMIKKIKGHPIFYIIGCAIIGIIFEM